MKDISKKIDIYQEEILKRNYRNFKAFTFGGMLLTGMIALVAWACYGHVFFTREYTVLFSLFALYNAYVGCFLKHHRRYTVLSFYIAMIPILAIGILMGTFLDPTSNAMTIMIMLCTLFVFITDKPRHILGYILTAAVIFLVCSYMCKSTDLFISDTVNLVIYLSVGLSVNMLTLKDRVESAENYTLAINRANSDALTSVLNRGAGDTIVNQLLENGQKGAFIIADIDDFKRINDTYGHQVGDDVICAVSQQFKKVFRDDDIVWRLGGDEFAVFALNLKNQEICEERMKQVRERILDIKISKELVFDIKISMGCTICCSENLKMEDVYKKSDDALYEAKYQGKDGYVIRILK